MLDKRLSSTIGALRLKYIATLPDRQRQLAEQVLILCDDGFTEEGRVKLFYLVHNIVGVAPTYGLPYLGQLAAAAEVLLTEAKGKEPLPQNHQDALIVAMEKLVIEMGQPSELQATS